MTIAQFAQHMMATNQVTHCYIALMPCEGQYDLEVEVNEGSIAAQYRTEMGLARARVMADELDTELQKRGVRVYLTRREWKQYLEQENDEA